MDVLIFTTFYLESCVWPDAISRWIRQRNSDDAVFLSRVITGDKSWIYGYDPETKQRSYQWKSPNSPRPNKARQVKIKIKRMIIISYDIKGIVHKVFILASQTANSAYYHDVLRRLRENVRRLCPELWLQENWLLHHDNASSHTSFLTMNF
jgi:hypothetical protein